jgi:hypothetical protein
MRYLLLSFLLISSCVGHELNLRDNSALHERVELAGKTMECAGQAHQDAVAWGTMGALMSATGAGLLSYGLNQNDDRTISMALATLGFSTVFSGVSLFRQFESAEYQAQSGALMSGSGNRGCEKEPPGPTPLERIVQEPLFPSPLTDPRPAL